MTAKRLLTRRNIYSNIRENSSFEWAHIYLEGTPIPPHKYGSFNYTLWELLKIREGRDLLISPYYTEKEYDLMMESSAPIVQFKCKYPLIKRIQNRLLRELKNEATRHNIFSPVSIIVADIIREFNIKNILLWNVFDLTCDFRTILPECKIALSQRVFDYKLDVKQYDSLDYLTTLSYEQTRHLFRNLPRLTPLSITIPNGTNTELFCMPSKNEKSSIRRKIGIKDSEFVLIFPSKLAAYKGTSYLLKLIDIAKRRRYSWTFLVVGYIHRSLDLSKKDELERILRNSNNVIWVNGVNANEMPIYYKAADLAVLPFVCKEAFSLCGCEALASGLPLIASRAGGPKEFIKDSYNGYLCRQEYLIDDMIKSILLLYKDRSKLKSMSANARKYAEKCLSLDRYLKNYCAFLEYRHDDIENDLSIPE